MSPSSPGRFDEAATSSALHILTRAETALDICRPAGEIYAYLSDFERHWEWAHTILSVEPLTPGSAVVGSRYRARERQDWRSDKRPFTIIEDRPGLDFMTEIGVTALEPGRRIEWESRNLGGPPLVVRRRFMLASVEASITAVRLEGQIDAADGVLEEYLRDFRARGYPVDLLARQCDRAMHNARAILEGRGTPGP